MQRMTGTLALQRFLALFLFGGSLLFGLAIPAATASLLRKPSQTIGIVLAVALTAWTLGWLGKTLWSGQQIPRWFIAGFFLVLLVGQLGCALCCDTWTETGALLSTFVPSALAFRSIVREYPGKPPKPLALDEF